MEGLEDPKRILSLHSEIHEKLVNLRHRTTYSVCTIIFQLCVIELVMYISEGHTDWSLPTLPPTPISERFIRALGWVQHV